MKIRVQLFGPLAEQAGTAQLTVEVAGGTVRDVLAAVGTAVPSIRIDRSLRVAVNMDYADVSTPVREADLVSLIPPVGGG